MVWLDRFLQWDPRLGRIYGFSRGPIRPVLTVRSLAGKDFWFLRVLLDRFLQWDPRLCVLLWHSFWVWFHVHVLDWTQATQLCWRGQALLCCGGQRWMRDGQPCKVSQGHLEDPLMGPTFTDSMHFRRVTPCLKASNSYFAGVQLQCTEFLWWYTCICIGNERKLHEKEKYHNIQSHARPHQQSVS